jgi:hypothetical protein
MCTFPQKKVGDIRFLGIRMETSKGGPYLLGFPLSSRSGALEEEDTTGPGPCSERQNSVPITQAISLEALILLQGYFQHG